MGWLWKACPGCCYPRPLCLSFPWCLHCALGSGLPCHASRSKVAAGRTVGYLLLRAIEKVKRHWNSLGVSWLHSSLIHPVPQWILTLGQSQLILIPAANYAAKNSLQDQASSLLYTIFFGERTRVFTRVPYIWIGGNCCNRTGRNERTGTQIETEMKSKKLSPWSANPQVAATDRQASRNLELMLTALTQAQTAFFLSILLG